MKGHVEADDRFEVRDERDAGRIIQVDEYDEARGKWKCHVDVAPKNPETVGRVTHLSSRTLLSSKWARVSR